MTRPAAPRPSAPRSSGALLVDRNFGPWFWGNLASNSGNWLFNVTAAVVVFELTRSALLVGLVSVAQFAPLAVISPWAGALSDRTDRRRLVLLGQSLAALAATALAAPALLLGVERLPGSWPVLLAALGIGIGKAVSGPAAKSLVPALVPDADLESAVSLTAVTYMVGRALGPGVAGALLVTLGPAAAFVLNAVSFLTLIAALVVVRGRPQPEADGESRSVRAGLRYVLDHRRVLLLLGGGTAAGFAADPVITLAPSLTEVLGGGDGHVAAMVSGFGIAAVPAALLSGRWQRAVGSLRIARNGMLLMATGLLLTALAPRGWVAVAGFAAAGGGFILAGTSFSSVLLRHVPDPLRGRVMALWAIGARGTRPVAAMLDGAAADLAGPRLAMGITVVVALIGAWLAVRLERADVNAGWRVPSSSSEESKTDLRCPTERASSSKSRRTT